MSYPCPHCGGDSKNAGGKPPAGKQRRKCKDCNKGFTVVLNQTNDIAEDTLSSENIRDDTPAKGKAGPKKVLSETSKIIGNNIAGMLADSTQVKAGAVEKGLSYQESQSIVHPTIRIVWRRVPEVAKDALPDIPGLEKEDVADLLEIATTFARFMMRRFEIWYHGWRNKQLSKNTPIQRGQPMPAPAPAASADVDAFFAEADEQPPDLMAQSQQSQPVRSANGHDPAMVAMLPGDMGLVEG